MREPAAERGLVSEPAARRLMLPRQVRAGAAAREMQRRSESFLAGRTELIGLALNAKREARHSSAAPGEGIWQYWDSGLDRAPDVVAMAMASVHEHAWAPVRLVTDDTIADYVDLPAVIRERRDRMTATHFSDVLRLHLLAEHGGTWVDATVMLTGPRPDAIADAEFFAYSRPEDPFLLSSWYLQSRPGDPLIRAWRDMLVAYWEANTDLREYFLLHFLFEALVTCHAWARRRWLDAPVFWYQGPHRLQEILQAAYDPDEVERILSQEWLNKLTYKLPESDRAVSGPTVLEQLLADRRANG